MRIEYQYGATDMRESITQTVTPQKSSSSSATVEEDRGDITLPLHHEVNPTQRTGAQTFDPSGPVWSSPVKSFSSRVQEYQRENTPLTMPSLDDHSSDSSFTASLRCNDDLDDDDLQVRFAINHLNLQHSLNNAQLGKSKSKVVLQTFCPKLVLEVMGGSGAVWGFSEAIGLRTALTLWFWQPVTLIAGAFFFIRWCQQVQEFSRLHDLRSKRRSALEGEMATLLCQENV